MQLNGNPIKKESKNRWMPKTSYLNERCTKMDQEICKKKKNKFELAKNSKNKCNNFFFERQEDEPSK